MNTHTNPAAAVRHLVSAELTNTRHVYLDAAIDRQHIFYSLLEKLTHSRPSSARLGLIHEFVIIEAIVAAIRFGNNAEVNRLIDEVRMCRNRCFPEGPVTGLLDALLLPALALHDLEQGKLPETLGKLRSSIGELNRHWLTGVEEAGAAILEQQLNLLRAYGRFGQAKDLARRGALFVLGLLGAEGEDIEVTAGMAGNVKGDKEQKLAYYINKAVEKVVSVEGALEEFLEIVVVRAAAAPTNPSLVLIGALESIVKPETSVFGVGIAQAVGILNSSEESVTAMPAAIAVLIDTLTQEWADGPEDGLSLSLQVYLRGKIFANGVGRRPTSVEGKAITTIVPELRAVHSE